MGQYIMTDTDLLIATQIAYLDAGDSRHPNITIGELIDSIRSKYGVYNESTGEWEARGGLKGKMSSQLETANYLQKLMEDHGAVYARNWKVVDRCDMNNSSGFYGCLIDTGDGNSIVGFRGSESFDGHQGVMDWGVADVGMLNNALTIQQKNAEDYIRYIYENYGDKYNSFSLTGHSLGGNLAQHAGNMAPDEMRGKINHVVSWDGPGFSDEYINAHRVEINKAKEYQSHYQYSWVGSLLTPLPGTEDRVIKAHDDPTAGGSTVGISNEKLWRHHTRNIELAPDGSVQDGEMSDLSKALGPLSKTVDGTDWMILLLIPGIGKPLRLFAEVYKDVKFVYTIFHNGKVYLEQEFQKFKQNVRRIIKDIMTPNVSGTYYAVTNGMLGCARELESIERDMLGISSEVNTIERTLLYDSICGSYAKSKLKLIRIGIGNDAKKTQKSATIISNCAQRYNAADRSAQDKFSI